VCPDAQFDARKADLENLLRVALPVCDARRTFVRLRFLTSTAAARYGFVEISNINRGILAATDEFASRSFHAQESRFRPQERISPPFYLII